MQNRSLSGMYGKHHTEETKKKLSDFWKGRWVGNKSPQWRGGRKMAKGYIYIWAKNHPHATKKGYVAEHRLVMEKSLGRYLTSKEVVHHKDHNKTNNSIENLELVVGSGKHLIKFHVKRDKKSGRFTRAK